MVGVSFVLMVAILLASKEINSSFVAQHRKSRKEVAVTNGALSDILVRGSFTEQDCTWNVRSTFPALNKVHALHSEDFCS